MTEQVLAVQRMQDYMVLGSQALRATLERLKERVADYETQTELAASTDYPAGE